MNRRPIAVTVIGLFFIIMGVVTLAVGIAELANVIGRHAGSAAITDIALMCLTRLLAIIVGVLLLLGFGWARWLALAWMAFHVVRSLFHSPVEVAIHIVFLLLLSYFLFRRSSAAFFQRA